MTVATNVSAINTDNISSAFGEGINKVEGDLSSALTDIQNNANPTAQDLLVLQNLMVRWQYIVQANTGVLRAYGDTMKAVANNIGT